MNELTDRQLVQSATDNVTWWAISWVANWQYLATVVMPMWSSCY